MEKIPPEKRGSHDWGLTLQSEEGEIHIEPEEVHHAKLETPKFGVSVELGLRDEGYVSIIIRQNNGGGGVVLPWAIIDGKLHVAGVMEARPNLSTKKTLCAIGGMVNSDETVLRAALRETQEETGLILTQDDVQLTLDKGVSDRFFFHCINADGEEDGISVYSYQVPEEKILRNLDGTFSINLIDARGSKECILVPWTKAAKGRDMIFGAAVASLMANEPSVIGYL